MTDKTHPDEVCNTSGCSCWRGQAIARSWTWKRSRPHWVTIEERWLLYASASESPFPLPTYIFLRGRGATAESFPCDTGSADSAMKRGIGVGPDPLKGQNQDKTSKVADGEAGVKGTSGAPAKPRSNTVATFLRPQLSPGNTSDRHRQRPSTSTTGYCSTAPARVQERRNALVGSTTAFAAADIHEIRSTHKAFDGGVVDSSSSMSARTPGQAENSFNVSRQTGHSSIQLNASDRCTGTGVQDITDVPTGTARDPPTASAARGTAAAHGRQSPNSPSLESSAAHRSCQSSATEIFEGKSSDCPSQTGRSTATSARQTRSLQEFNANRRALSAYCQDRTKQSSTATAGLGKSREAENGRVGFTAPSDKVPTSYFLSALRTKESLLVPGEGRAYHLGVQRGELHNRILTVGHAGRADWLAERFLDPHMRTLSLKSNRNFRLHSGGRISHTSDSPLTQLHSRRSAPPTSN